MKVKLGSII